MSVSAELSRAIELGRLERLACDLERHGPIDARVVRRRRGDSRLAIAIDGRGELDWWSFWGRRVQVSRLLRLEWVDEVGWMALFEPEPGTPPGEPGLLTTADGTVLVRLFAWRVRLVA